MRTRLLLTLCILCLLLPVAALAQSIDDYTIFSNNTLILRDRAKIKNAVLGSNTGLQMGYDAVLTGEVKSKGNMLMYDRSLVTGNVTLGGALTRGAQARVTGTVIQYASVPVVANPTFAFTLSPADVTVNAQAMKRIPPGNYRNVLVSAGGTLLLYAGTYYFNTLTLQADAVLIGDTSSGQVAVEIMNELKIDARVRVILGAGTLKALDFQIYSGQTTALAIGTDGRLETVLTLPRAAVTLGDRTSLVGKLRAKGVTVGYDCPVNGAVSVDTDGDGMPDGWEMVNGLNPAISDAHGDPDADGLDNLQELGYETKAKVADTDSDGLKDGAEINYWTGRTDGIGWWHDSDNDGLPNIVDPDSDNDALADGRETAGWTMTVQGTVKTCYGDPINPDTDGDGIIDSKERDGYSTDFPNHTVHAIGPDSYSTDADGDGLDKITEKTFGLNPADAQTLGNIVNDKKYWEMVNRMGEWAVSPTTGHLNPQLASTATSILGANVGFGDDTAATLSIDRQMEMCVFLPQDGLPVTLKLDFIYDSGSTPDAADKFYSITYSGAVFPGGTSGAPAITYGGAETNAITWRIGDPLYNLKGDYFFNFSYHYDKNNGEKPRQIRMYAYYDDGTRVRIEYLSPVKAGTYRSPMHFNLLVTGGAQPAFFRGETAVSTAANSYIDNVKLTDSSGNTVRSIGKKAFNGYWFQYPLGKLNTYPGGVSGTTACQRLEFDWVHDAATDKQHVVFAIDEVGNKWDEAQITYDRTFQTQDYYCWYGGVARNGAVLRRGASIRVVAANSGLQTADAQVTVRNRAGTDVTSRFTVHKETGAEDYAAWDGSNATWRENWIVEAPASLPLGMYTVTLKAGSWTANTSFSLVFNRSDFTIADAEYAGYCYDEDTDGLALDADGDNAFELYARYYGPMGYISAAPFSKEMTQIAVAVSEGCTKAFDAHDAIRIFSSKMIWGAWHLSGSEWTDPHYKCSQVLTALADPDEAIRFSGLTVAEALSGRVDDAHLLYGECMEFAKFSTGMARAVGIPGRMVEGWDIYIAKDVPDPIDGTYKPSAESWPNHAWSEAWIENPPTGTDHWYVFDSTTFSGTILGCSQSRWDRGSVWMMPTGTAVVSDFADIHNKISVTSFYH